MQENYMKLGYLLRCFLDFAQIGARDRKGNVLGLDSVPVRTVISRMKRMS